MAAQLSSERAAELLEQCAGYDYIRFTFSDIHGIPKCKTVPAKHLEKYIKEGVHTCVGEYLYFLVISVICSHCTGWFLYVSPTNCIIYLIQDAYGLNTTIME